MTDIRQEDYIKLELLPLIPASVVEYLMDNNELMWKLLYYNTNDAWSKSNLTKAQKSALIYDGSDSPENFRVFLDTGQDSAITEQISILRISTVSYVPRNHIIGYYELGIEVYSHYQINTLSNYQVRTDAIIASVIGTINGANIENTSRLFFDASKNPRCKVMTIGTAPFKGKGAILCTNSP